MKNKTVKLVISLVVLVALCGTYFGVQNYVKKQEEDASEEEEDTSEEVFSADADNIQSLKFLVDKNEVTFVREDGTWYKDDEREFPVDQDVLSDAASSVSEINADRVLDDVENLNEYDLDSPQNTITVKTEDGNETVIRVGMKNDSTSQYYITLNDEKNKVYVVDSSPVEPYLKSLYDYAKAGEFPSVDSASIKRISVEKEDVSYQFEKDTDTDLWYVVEGDNRDLADSSKINTLTGSVGSLTYNGFVDYNCTDDAKYGFDKPYAVMKIEYQEEETVEDSSSDESEDLEADEENGSVEMSDPDDADSDSSDSESSDSNSAGAGSTNSDSVDSESSASDLPDTNSADSDSSDSGLLDSDSLDTNSSASDLSDSTSSDSSDEEPETVLVDKELTLYIGGVNGDDRYVKVDDSKEIYTLSIGTVEGLVDKELSDYWDLTVNYLSVNQLENIDVSRNNETHTVNVSRETTETEGEDGEEPSTTTTLKYNLDGVQLESNTDFITFYNKLINLVAQKRLTEVYTPENNEDMSVKLKDVNGNLTMIDFYEYDVNFYAAVVNDEKVYLINKMTYRELAQAYDNFITSSQDSDESEKSNDESDSSELTDSGKSEKSEVTEDSGSSDAPDEEESSSELNNSGKSENSEKEGSGSSDVSNETESSNESNNSGKSENSKITEDSGNSNVSNEASNSSESENPGNDEETSEIQESEMNETEL